MFGIILAVAGIAVMTMGNIWCLILGGALFGGGFYLAVKEAVRDALKDLSRE